MQSTLVKITGTSPLLCGRPVHDLAAKDAAPNQKAASRLYLDPKGQPVIPGHNLFRSILGAAPQIGYDPIELIHNLGIQERELLLVSPAPWLVDTRSVRNPETGERSLCYRPRFEDWSLQFTLLADLEVISREHLRFMVETAGKIIGLGDYRPERGGPFGCFVIDAWGDK